MHFHFISGLPRSGSTLLASILRQNPRFTSNIESPTGKIILTLQEAMTVRNESEYFITDTVRVRLLRAIFTEFYATECTEVVFDNNRRWCANADLILTLFPDAFIICCVRHPAMILDSFEQLARSSPLTLSMITDGKSNLAIHGRFHRYLAPDGVVGYAWRALQSAWFSPRRERLIIVDYNRLAAAPGAVLQKLHGRLGEPLFEYDFEHILQIPGVKEFDARTGTPGLHNLRNVVSYAPSPMPVFPPELARTIPTPFWEGSSL